MKSRIIQEYFSNILISDEKRENTISIHQDTQEIYIEEHMLPGFIEKLLSFTLKTDVQYFRRPQRNGIQHYYQVYGGPGKTEHGYQIVVNFLNDHPIIAIEQNCIDGRFSVTGTWDTFETGERITKEEFMVAFRKASGDPNVKVR
jgi:hypothetical protein